MRGRLAECPAVAETALSAGGVRPLSNVPFCASGDGPKEAQQRDKRFATVTGEATEKRGWQLCLIDGRHEPGAGDLPERRGRETLAPPSAPAPDRSTVDADDLREPFHPGIGRAIPQDRNQHDKGRDMDPSAEKAQRRRRLSAPASVDVTTEAEPLVVLGTEATGQRLGASARLARVSGRVQATATCEASVSPAGICKITIDGEQQLVETGIGQQGCVQGRCPLQREG